MAYLTFISDAALKAGVARLLTVAEDAVARSIAESGRNKIDPFSALFEMAGFNLSYQEWQHAEQARQAQKTLSNEVGLFHQHILGSVTGWQNLGTGDVVDLVCDSRQIVAEVKNKHNTVKGSDKIGVYDNLENEVASKGHKHRGYTAYYVEIIPSSKRGYDKAFTPSDNKKALSRPSNEKIRVIDGRRFYALVTGVDDALDMLHEVLPHVIEDCSKTKYKFKKHNLTLDFFKSAFGR
jgi:hypothetical protein